MLLHDVLGRHIRRALSFLNHLLFKLRLPVCFASQQACIDRRYLYFLLFTFHLFINILHAICTVERRQSVIFRELLLFYVVDVKLFASEKERRLLL